MSVWPIIHFKGLLVEIPEASSTMREVSGARCTDARLYTLRIKVGTRTTSARERCIVELASGTSAGKYEFAVY